MARSINHLLNMDNNIQPAEILGYALVGGYYIACIVFILTLLNFILSMLFNVPFIPGLILEACGVDCTDTIGLADTY